MILIAARHKREIDPLLELYSAKREGKFYKSGDILFIAGADSSLSLSSQTAYTIGKYPSIKIAMLFGLSGSVSNFEVGDFAAVNRVSLIDKHSKPIFNPINMKEIASFSMAKLVSVIDGVNLDSNVLNHFGDIVDNEGYFFAKTVKETGAFGIIIKFISDNNKKSQIEKIKREGFNFNPIRIKQFIDSLLKIDSDELKLEIFKHTGICKDYIINGLNKLFTQNHLSFSNRQKIYRKIKINSSKPHINKFYKPAAIIEKDIDRSRIKMSLNGLKTFEVDDYVPYFHNLKDKSAVIFANKKGEFLRKTPDSYTPDGKKGYSILNAYNCIYDCSYCFLKGYFKSFNPVIFLNYEDYFDEITKVIESDRRRPLYFFAGTFSDSFALMPYSNFNTELIKFFRNLKDDIYLEFRTKSAHIKDFLSIKPSNNIILAFSLSPDSVIKRLEFMTPALKKRLNAIELLDRRGFKIGIRIDPVIIDYLDEYNEIINSIKQIRNIHSVEVGFLRFDKNGYKNMLNSKNAYILKTLEYSNGMYRYDKDKILRAKRFFQAELKNFNFYKSMEFEN